MDDLIHQIYSRANLRIDIIARRELLVENLDRIFANQGDVEAWEHHEAPESLDQSIITSASNFMKSHIPQESQRLINRVFFINQGHSWSRLQVTADLMLRIVSHYQLSPLMLDFLHCFGSKVMGDDNPYYGTFHASFSTFDGEATALSQSHYDFCCHLRRFERHGNPKLQDPWSLRQMATCQRFDIMRQTSTWVFIKPMQHFQEKLKVLLSGESRHNPMAPHLLCLTMASENWRWYIDFLRRRLGEFSEKAIYSSVNASNLDYDINFSDSQRLSTLESKLTVAISVLGQNLAIGHGMKRHCRRLWRIKGLKLDQNLQSATELEIEMLLTHLNLHRKSCELLLHRVHGTCAMLLKISDVRNDMIMKDYSRIATELAKVANAQNNSLHMIAQDAKRDSTMMKILTIIAIVFLPPSLIASIFSTDLIKMSDRNANSDTFHVSKDMWIFVLSSSVVTVATVLSALLWTQRTV